MRKRARPAPMMTQKGFALNLKSTAAQTIAMVGAAVVAWLFLATGRRLKRREGALPGGAYVALLPLKRFRRCAH